MNWTNILSRAGFAALAAGVAGLVVPQVISDVAGWRAAGAVALAAAIGAFVSTLKSLILEALTGTTSITVSK